MSVCHVDSMRMFVFSLDNNVLIRSDGSPAAVSPFRAHPSLSRLISYSRLVEAKVMVIILDHLVPPLRCDEH